MPEVVEEKLQSKQEILVANEKTHKALEDTRVEFRIARAKLVEKIMCDGKDVLGPPDTEKIQEAFAKFLEVQERLGKCWFENASAFARMFSAVANSYPDLPDCPPE